MTANVVMSQRHSKGEDPRVRADVNMNLIATKWHHIAF